MLTTAYEKLLRNELSKTFNESSLNSHDVLKYGFSTRNCYVINYIVTNVQNEKHFVVYKTVNIK